MTTYRKLAEKALAADAAFTAELERAYGKRRAGDARYYRRHDDPRVERAARRYVEAAEAMGAEAARMRGERPAPARRRNAAKKKRTTKKAGSQRAPARGTSKARRAPGRHYRARYRNGKTLTFRARSDAAARQYATGLGAHRAGSSATSLKPTPAPKGAKKKTRRRAKRAAR